MVPGLRCYFQKNKGLIRQLLAGLTVSWTALQNGLYLGWPSPIMKSLSGGGSEGPLEPFARRWSENEISWMVAALDLGNIFSPLPCSRLVDRWGRKPLLILMAPLSILSWTLVYLGTSVTAVCVARVLQGFQCGIASTVVPLYLSEISEPQVRGAINTIPAVAVNIGILFCYTAGPYVSYKTLTTLCIILSIPYAVTVYHIPESPYFHLMNKNVFKARRFLEWTRTEFRDDELAKMRDNVNSEMEASAHRPTSLARHDFIALFVVLFMYIAPTFTFYWVIPEYAARTFSTSTFTSIFNATSKYNATSTYNAASAFDPTSTVNVTSTFNAASTFNPTLTSNFSSPSVISTSTLTPDQYTILLGVFTLAGTLPSTYLIDRLGRRQITLLSAMLTAVFAYLTSGYLFLAERQLLDADRFSWCTCIFTSGLLCSASLGLGQMYCILQSEYFPSNSRALAGATVAAIGSIFSVVADKIYLSIADSIGMYFNFCISGSVSLLVCVFAWFFMIETRGRTFAEIQALIRDRWAVANKYDVL
ncbi:unnamed protein product [Bemisia tabaci]|uniref:Major facilitator superfamily (MFS) profile domain-containing protein n=2 Tax=Bemisia tabaci TaxID=7038 RepID=A0A9P0CAV5_BEMTA|nr:PREDICTED: sugar transporter ERD6-like 8 isoform X3 [Bemisia tabaci]CAH0767746.1 unnamed protein product [Bemisia tabaci]